MLMMIIKFFFVKFITQIKIFNFYNFFTSHLNMNLESRKKYPNKKFLKSAKFEAKEQFTQSALDNLTKENDLLIKNLRKAGEINEKLD